MHILINHIRKYIGICLFLIFSICISPFAYSEQSAESIIKERKALFSKNYKTAKRVQSLSASGDVDEAKNFCPLKILGFNLGVGLIILVSSLKITK